MEVPQMVGLEWKIMENPIEMDDLGEAPFQETSIYSPMYK